MARRKRMPTATRKRLIFDNDGTISNSLPKIDETYKAVLRPYGIPERDIVPFFRATTGWHFTQQARELCKRHGHEMSEAEAETLHLQFSLSLDRLDVEYFPDVALTLALLAQQHDMFVSSAAPDRAVWHAIAHGVLSRHIIVGFGSTLVPKGRAHVEGFAKSLRVPLQEFCESAIWIGDSVQDMRVAKECGIYALGVRGSDTDKHLRDAGADRLIDSVADLRSLLA